VLQCVPVCSSVLQCDAFKVLLLWGVDDSKAVRCIIPLICCSVLQCVVFCCSVLQCVAVCCSVLQCVAGCCSALPHADFGVLLLQGSNNSYTLRYINE